MNKKADGPAVVSRYQKSTKTTVHRSELTGASYNPRSIDKVAARRLRESIRCHGLVGGIVWNRRTGNLVGGHQRIAQLDDLEGGNDYLIEVDAIDVDEVHEREINIALNNLQIQGKFDHDKLAELMLDLHQKGRNVERTGYSSHDQLEMLGDDVLTGDFARQRDAEKPHIDKIGQVRDIGSAADADYFDTDGGSGGEASGESGDRDRGEHRKGADDAGDEFDEPEKKDYTEELRQRRKDYPQEIRDEEEANVMVTFTFDTNIVLTRFLRHFKLDSSKRYFDRLEVEAAFGVTLTDG